MEFILASASPRRKELLKRLINSFSVVASDADETFEAGQAPYEFAVKTAEKKAMSVFAGYPEAAVIGADTIVVCDGEIMGKPLDDTDAVRMLKKLRGRTHEVITGLCLVYNGNTFLTYETTEVEFDDMTDDEILMYVETGAPADKASGRIWNTDELIKAGWMTESGEWKTDNGNPPECYDKAGAYGIQGRAGIFIKGIKGCYFNVVGLPLNALKRLMKYAGINAVNGGII